MSTFTAAHDLATDEQTVRTTRGLLVALGVIAVPQLAFAALIALITWVEIAGMTAAERAESWAELGYFLAVAMAVPPVVGALIGGSAWAARRRVGGVVLAAVAVGITGLSALFWLSWLVPSYL